MSLSWLMLFLSSIRRRMKLRTSDKIPSFSGGFRNGGRLGVTPCLKTTQIFDVTGMTTVLSSMSFGVAGRHGCKPRECIFGLNPRPASVLGEALTNLRIVRWGGHPWTTKEVEERLNALGFERFEAVLPSPPVLFVLGQKPPRYGREHGLSRSAEVGLQNPKGRFGD